MEGFQHLSIRPLYTKMGSGQLLKNGKINLRVNACETTCSETISLEVAVVYIFAY